MQAHVRDGDALTRCNPRKAQCQRTSERFEQDRGMRSAYTRRTTDEACGSHMRSTPKRLDRRAGAPIVVGMHLVVGRDVRTAGVAGRARGGAENREAVVVRSSLDLWSVGPFSRSAGPLLRFCRRFLALG